MNPSISLLNLPLSVEAHSQFLDLQELFSNHTFTDEFDCWNYIWGSSEFSCQKAYEHLKGFSGAPPIFGWIWKSSCQPKHKIFFWLLIQDRISSRDLLRRKQMPLPCYNCVLCNSGVCETVVHLFLECPFAKECWGLIGLTVTSSSCPLQRFQNSDW